MTSPLSPHQFVQQHVPGGHGADDYESDEGEAYTLRAIRGKKEVGNLTYNLTSDEAHVRWVESQAPGTGVGGGLVRHLRSLHPNHAVTTNDFTEDGERIAHLFDSTRGTY